MFNILTNYLILRLLPFGVTVARNTLNVLVLVRIQEGQFLKFADRKKDMEQTTDNLESDPYKSQDLNTDLTERGISDDVKGYINGHCKIFTGGQKAFC